MVISVEKGCEERMGFFLKQRFTAGKLHTIHSVFFYFGDNFSVRQFSAVVISIVRIAIGAPQVTSGKPDKGTGQTGVRRFSLNAFEDFVNL